MLKNNRFPERLIQAMKQAGYASSRNPSGVSVSKLAQITHHSQQMCRRYLNGDAIPGHKTIILLAEALNINPGYLLFGSSKEPACSASDSLTINTEVLHYFFSKLDALGSSLYSRIDKPSDFLCSTLKQIATLELDADTLIKVLDMAFRGLDFTCRAESDR
jgi:transcriptional regulator with XRE-family HTH domain